MRVVVAGRGSAGLAMAFWITMHGHEVDVLSRRASGARVTGPDRRIHASGHIEGEVEVRSITRDPGDVIPGTDVIVLAVTADDHASVIEWLAPFLSERQAILLCPGRTGGALQVAHRLRVIGAPLLGIFESSTLPFACRRRSDNHVEFIATKASVAVASVDRTPRMDHLSQVLAIHPSFSPATSMIATSLHNFGAVLHPAGMWGHWSQSSERSMFYRAMPAAGIDRALAIDGERLQICDALGWPGMGIESWIVETYPSASGSGLRDTMSNCAAYDSITCPASLHHRYLIEDVPTGLIPMMAIAAVLKVDTPMMEATTRWACEVTGRDFWSSGRDLESMGLGAPDEPTIRRALGVL